MENLTDAGKKSSARSGLQKLKRIRDEMFKKRHQSLKEEDENKQNQENSPAGTYIISLLHNALNQVQLCALSKREYNKKNKNKQN